MRRLRPTHRLRVRTLLATDLDDAWRTLAEPGRLDQVTPPWFRLRVVGRPEGALRVGSAIDYRVRWRGVPLRWRSRIVEWDHHRSLGYEQEIGPYHRFVHRHRFRETGGGVVVDDIVDFRPRGGELVARAVVGGELERIFRYRAASLGAPEPEISRSRLQPSAPPDRAPEPRP